jgi:TP901 family phage tail tape measure protein
MNITVRVVSAQALAQLRAVQTQVAATGAGAGRAGGALENMLTERAMSRTVKLGNALQWTGRQLQYNFTLPIALAGVAASKFALDNEKAATRIVKVYGDVGMSQQQITNETNALRGAFVALSNHFGVQQKEVLDVAAAWAAAGASGVALAKDVKLTMETMVLGEMNATEATDALIAIQAQYNQSTDQLTKTIQILNMVENQTGISMQGLVQGFARAAGTAAGAGVDVRHLAAMLAAMTPAAGSAAQAGNALKTILSRLFAPTKDSAAVMKEMGISVETTAWQSKNGSQRLETLADSFVKLNKAQQTAASSIIASRFQINKFGTLMKDIANRNAKAGDATSYYGRALQSTADKTAVYNQMQRELNQVLSSNPQRLKQIWTILQNAMADVVQPMIPVILMAADALRRLAQWFSNLPPGVQKLIGTLLVFIALFGPLLRYLGSLITLIGELRFFFLALAMPIQMVVGWIGGLVSIIGGGLSGALTVIRAVFLGAGGAAMGFLGVLARLTGGFLGFIGTLAGGPMRALGQIFVGGFAVLGRQLAFIWSGTWIAIRAITATGASWVGDAFLMVFGRNLLASFSAFGTAMVSIWNLSLRALMASTRIFAVSGVIAFQVFFSSARSLIAGGWAALVGGFRFGLYGLIGLMTSLPGLLLRAGPALISGLATLGRVAVIAFTSPWGAAIAAVVGVIYLFRNQISQIISNIIQMFYQLPGGIVGALRAVVDVVQAAAMQVYEWMQYLNPFARHSPSVVDNVTAGMAVVRKEISSITKVSGPLQQAAADMQRYGQVVANLKNQMAAAQRADDRSSIGKINPGALGAFDALNRDLGSLNKLLAASESAVNAQQRVVDAWSTALDRANAALDVQQAKLDQLQNALSKQQDLLSAAKDRLSTWANTPIQGMKAMSDAIFANDMAQKRLQLQMMKMEDAVGPIDKLKDRISKLNGEMELAHGTANDLRAKGAGSDILKVYDQQIGALGQQKKAIENQMKPYDDLSAALEKLQRQGQELDLQNSLKFDPLTRQIEQAANAMKEMPFDVIMRGVQGAQADIAKYTAAVDQASAAVRDQQAVVDNLKRARDAVSATYDAENKKLDQLKKSYQGVQDAIDGVKGALGDMSGAANDAIQRQEAAARAAAEQARKEKAARDKAARDAKAARDKAAKARKAKKGPKVPGLSPAMQAFQDAGGAKDFANVLGKGGIGREGPAGDQSKMIDDFTKDMAKQTASMFDGFDIFGPIKDMWNKFWTWLQPKIQAVKDFIGRIFQGVDFAAPFRNMDFSWLNNIKNIIVGVVDFVTEWVGKLWKLFGPDIIAIGQNLWTGIQSIWKQIQPQLAQFSELWGPLGQAIQNIWTIAKPILAVFALAIIGLGSVLLHVLANVIGPVFEAIGGILAGALSIIRGFMRIIIGIFTLDWSMVWKGVVDIFGGAWKIIVALFVGVGKTLWGIVSGIVTGIVNFFKWLVDVLVGHSIIPDLINGIWTWFKKLISLPGWILTYVLTAIFNFISTWWSKSVQPKITAVHNGITDILHKLSALPGWLKTNVWDVILTNISTWWSKNVSPKITAVKDGITATLHLLSALPGWLRTNVWDVILTNISTWWSKNISPKVTAIKDGITSGFHALSAIPGWLRTNVWDKITSAMGSLWNDTLRPLGNRMIAGFANIFNNVGHAIVAGINLGIGAVNKLIDGLNWVGSHVPGLSFSIGKLGGATYTPWKPPQFATGGGLPASKVGAGFKTNGIRAIVGEGNPAHPEFVIPTDPKYRSRSRMLIAQAAKEAGIGFDLGGILGGIGSVVGKVKDTILSTGSTLIRKAVSAAFSPIYDAAMHMTDGIDNRMHLRDMIRSPFNWVRQWADGIENAVPKDVPAGGGPMPSGSDVQRWAPMMLKALAASGLPASLLPNELRQIQTESGGNPNAVQGNIGDINNITGDLAKGLLQVIGGTFRAYHVPGTSNNVFDPWANMMASLNYQKHRYGPSPQSIAAVIGHGHGYARGGKLPMSIFDTGGYLRPGLSLSYNGTGKSERVLTPRQESSMMGPREVHFHGDLSFPSVRDGRDAEDFIKNLEILAGGR